MQLSVSLPCHESHLHQPELQKFRVIQSLRQQFYLLSASVIQKYTSQIYLRINIFEISKEDFKKQMLKIPSFEKQKHIAVILNMVKKKIDQHYQIIEKLYIDKKILRKL